jgi:hypothetical protein
MLEIAVFVFAVGALGGLVLASSVLRGKLAPWSISLIHAAVGAAGLILVALAVLGGGTGGLVSTALIILAVAALGGFYLASRHRKNEVAAKPVVLIHALVAVTGFVILTGSVYNLI